MKDLKRQKKESQPETERDEIRKAEALKSKAAWNVEEVEKEKRVLKVKARSASTNLAVCATNNEEEKKKRQEQVEKARKEEEEEVKKLVPVASKRVKVL